jgi:hypothetical protein
MFLLRGAVALLYLGPVLAGLSGFVRAQVPIFILLFLGWLVVMRPEIWPQHARDWRTSAPWLALAGRGLVQAVLVFLSLVVGHSIGFLVGPLPLPVWLPVLVSGSAILLGRWVWNPAKAAETEALLDDVLRRVNALTDDAEPDDLPQRLAPLLALDEAAPDDLVDRLLDDILEGDPAGSGFSALARRLRNAGAGHMALRRGVIRLATDPSHADMGKGSAAVTKALFIAGTAPDLLTLFLARAEALYAVRPDLWGDYPSPGTLREAAAAVADPAIAGRLLRMADRMEADDS